eukprot:CCRYP_016985-RA/>CCRYP_016985-RA protein AED:0.13 eAED:0.15 QI:0/0/0/1/1/1/2/0/544
MSSSYRQDFLTVDINEDEEKHPTGGSRSNDMKHGHAPADPNELPAGNVVDESVARQRSMLKTLWSEATSTTSFPQLHHQLHHRHTNASATNDLGDYNRKGSTGSHSSPSKRRTSTGKHSRHSHLRYSRSARIAKHVWLAAFAALAASTLIAVHIFIYRVLFGNNTNKNDKDADASLSVMQYLAPEDQNAAMTLKEAHSHRLKPITTHPIDKEQFTIRMNTWHRNEQLILSVNHHAKCEGVKEIQIVWCDSENEPPSEILHHKSGKVKVERHTINSLNERFKVLIDPPTLGILSLDDDVLRPCEALDAAFIRWTRHPERMVGFDVRTHVVDESEEGLKWKYGYMSTTESSNRYSLTLPRASFLHRDYLDLYTMALPRPMYAYIAQHFECEDIAMSFFVSSLSDGRPPLITDYWAVKSMVKLYSEEKISGGKDHKAARDKCVNDFGEMLCLKGSCTVGGVNVKPLQTGKIRHKDSFFGYGAEPEDWLKIDPQSVKSQHLQNLIETMQHLKSLSVKERMAWLSERIDKAKMEAKQVVLFSKMKHVSG